MPDHTHIFLSLQTNISISNLTGDIKANSSRWVKQRFATLKNFEWQEGFAAFSYAKSQALQVVNYILAQPVHHKKITFEQEYISFLKAFDIEFDTKYLFEFYSK